MDEKEKLMLERLRPERHLAALMTLANIKFIKKECTKNRKCINCRFYSEKEKYYSPCYICGNERTPEDWNEYELTERIYK